MFFSLYYKHLLKECERKLLIKLAKEIIAKEYIDNVKKFQNKNKILYYV